MPLALVFVLVGLLLIAAAVTVMYEDQREANRRARRRHDRLARIGEADRATAGPETRPVPWPQRRTSE